MTAAQAPQTGESIPVTFVETGEGRNRQRLAMRLRAGETHSEAPGIVWLGGFKSDMLSTKAARLDQWAAGQGRACLRFDYSGHGESSGRFEDGAIGAWFAESLAMIRSQTTGPQILVGSSMGGWIALLAARALAELGETNRLAGMALIAPAVDFTQELMWPRMPQAAREEIEAKGVWMRPSEYSPEPYPVTRALFEDGRKHLLLGGIIRSHCPVHILQGMKDPDVPHAHALRLMQQMPSDVVTLTSIRDGDHRLSREEDIARLLGVVAGM